MGIRKRAVESMVNATFWRGKRVFLTGHTGFKGTWLAHWLQMLGAQTTGFALPAADNGGGQTATSGGLPGPGNGFVSVEGDIRDGDKLTAAMRVADPHIVFHLAAQPLVRASYREPAETFAVNAAGTANVLQAVRSCGKVRAVVVVTSDKVYDNEERSRPFRENDRLGGHDPYSASKACAELVTASFRRSFYAGTPVAVATARSGNTIGGGDWSAERLVPDLVRGLTDGKPVTLRHPDSIRPWQHVLDALAGYLLLAERLYEDGERFAEAWNFGPNRLQRVTARELAALLHAAWFESGRHPAALREAGGGEPAYREARTLTLDSAKAIRRLGWRQLLAIGAAIRWTADWYLAAADGADPAKLTRDQIERYMRLGPAAGQTALEPR
ncbi:CDP-glucose 4,6-dehydratase [Paenibacillus cymbidii]|uniref:CDP-glucose 4,6-dehydratase n=1 Tax=Paenibacillus cymbidii TaxID=1639034 RepID=UPI001F41F3C3|nr:CDP-glucose 4,6-dehydratase [Paenibacillus cymbidii]